MSELEVIKKLKLASARADSKLRFAFDRLHSGKKALYIPYYSLGDPAMSQTLAMVDALVEGGADILELGFPFSDPTADGPVIQKAFSRALLDPSCNFSNCLDLIEKIHQKYPDLPMVGLCYFNLIHAYGMEKFLKRSQEIGLLGAVIPDLPYDSPEGLYMSALGIEYDFDLISMLTPQTSEKRFNDLNAMARGFYYYVSSFGVTGERSQFVADLDKKIANLKIRSKLPICIGFGINQPEQASEIASFADGVIVGSANHKIIEHDLADVDLAGSKLREYTLAMSKASHQ